MGSVMAVFASGAGEAALLVLCAAACTIAWVSVGAMRRARKALSTAQSRADIVVRATRAGVVDWDVASGEVRYSDTFKEMLGYPASHPGWGGDYMQLVHPEDRGEANEAFIDYLRTNRSDTGDNMHRWIEYRLRCADGGYLWVRGTGLGIRDETGRVVLYIASIIDIAEKKSQEQGLRNQFKFVDDLLDSLPMSVAIRDLAGQFTMVNRTWEQYYGKKREEVLGRSLAELAPAERAEPIEREDKAALEQKPGTLPRTQEILYLGRYYLQTRIPVTDALGTVTGVLTTGIDTTEQHRMQAELEVQRHRLALVVRAAKAGIIDWDAGARLAWFSEGFKMLLGYPPGTDSSVWADYFDTIHPEDRGRVRGIFAERQKIPSAPYSETLHDPIEYRLRRADDSYVWVQVNELVLRDGNGRVARNLYSITDITEGRAHEQELRDQVALTREIIVPVRCTSRTPRAGSSS